MLPYIFFPKNISKKNLIRIGPNRDGGYVVHKDISKNLDYIMNNYKDITHTRLGETDIHEDLKNAWACVVHTSTSGAVAMMEGIPMFSTHEACFSHKWSAGSLSDIENPILKDRTYYITHYANAHWNLDEVRKGLYWEKYAAS